MVRFAALDVSLETTAICVVDEDGRITAEGKVRTCPEAIRGFLVAKAPELRRVGLETGPLAVWLWNGLRDRRLPVVCLDARHANAALEVRPAKTDGNDAAGLARIVRTGWYKEVRIKTRASYEVRALLSARDVLVSTRVRLEAQVRGLPRTFGVLFGKRVGGFARRAREILSGELAAAPALREVVETLMEARADVAERIAALDRMVLAAAKADPAARLFMTAPGVGALAALSVASAFDEPGRFRSSRSVGAYLGLTPSRHESGEVSRSGGISKQGNGMTRKHLYEAATTLLTRTAKPCALKDWGLKLAEAGGFKKARVAVARRLAVVLHAMWKTGTEFRRSPPVAASC
jgi:transposase